MQLYSVVQCNTGMTGCGIIVNVQPIPEKRYDMYLTSCIYTLVTDFGNVVSLTQEELDANYTFICVEDNPLVRWNKQIDNINRVKSIYFKEKLNEF